MKRDQGLRHVSRIVVLVGLFATLTPGCTQKVEIVQTGPLAESPEAAMKRIKDDPVRFFEQTLAKTRKIKTLRMKFERQERLGLFRELKPIEHIIAEYRDQPFSVRFTWTDPGSDYRQCVYIQGKNKDRVALLPRKGLFGLPPSVGNYAPQLGVTFSKTRNPITDFGPRRMMERTLDRIEKAKPFGGTKITLLGIKEIGPAKEPCYEFQLVFPPGDEYPAKLQDLYIHTRTGLPVATFVWQSKDLVRSSETLEAMYLYGEMEPNVALPEGAFVIDANRTNHTEPEAGKVQAARVAGDGRSG